MLNGRGLHYSLRSVWLELLQHRLLSLAFEFFGKPVFSIEGVSIRRQRVGYHAGGPVLIKMNQRIERRRSEEY
jgi:hypothetical protein